MFTQRSLKLLNPKYNFCGFGFLLNLVLLASASNYQDKAEQQPIQINRDIIHCHFHFITALVLDTSSNPFFLNPLSYEIIQLNESYTYMHHNRTLFNSVRLKGTLCVYTLALFPAHDELSAAQTITLLHLRSRFLYANHEKWGLRSLNMNLFPKENHFFLAIVLDNRFIKLDHLVHNVRALSTNYNIGGYFAYIVTSAKTSSPYIHCHNDVYNPASASPAAYSQRPSPLTLQSVRVIKIWKNLYRQICRKKVKYPFKGNRIQGSISDLLEHFKLSTTLVPRYRGFFQESRLTDLMRGESYHHYHGPQREFHLVPYSSSSFSFISCIGKRDLSFSLYSKPFSPPIWLFLLIAISTVVLFLYCLIRHFPLKQLNASLNVLIFHVLSPMLGTDWAIPERLSLKQAYRLAFVFWLLLGGVVVTNAYLGCMITDLTSPVAVSGTLTKFQDLNKSSCASLCECIAELKQRYESEDILPKQRRLYKLLAEPLTEDDIVASNAVLQQRSNYDFSKIAEIDFLSSYHEYLGENTNCSQASHKDSVTRAFKTFMLIEHGYDLFPKHAKKLGSIRQAIESELVECNDAVFVKRTETMPAEFDYLTKSYKNLTFFTSESEFDGMEGLTVPEDGLGMKALVLTYIEVGLLQMHSVRMEKIKEIQRYNSFTRNNSKLFHKAFSPTSIQDSIQTLFFLVSFFLFVAVILLSFEVCFSINLSKYVTLYCTMLSQIQCSLHGYVKNKLQRISTSVRSCSLYITFGWLFRPKIARNVQRDMILSSVKIVSPHFSSDPVLCHTLFPHHRPLRSTGSQFAPSLAASNVSR